MIGCFRNTNRQVYCKKAISNIYGQSLLFWCNNKYISLLSTNDFSLKEESNNIDQYLLNFDKNDISFQKKPEMAEKESDFSFKFKNNYCGKCGTKVFSNYCPKCGNKNE